MTKEEKIELANEIAKAVVDAVKKTSSVKSNEEKLEFTNEMAKAVIESLKEISSVKNIDNSFEAMIKQITTIAPSIYEHKVRILKEDFIRSFSSGKLCDFTTCKVFLERKFLINNNFSEYAKKSAAYFTYIELEQPVVNPFFINGKDNLLSILLDIRPSDLKDVIHFKKYVVINSYEKFAENNTILPMGAELDIERYGYKIDIATGGKAIQHLLSIFDPKSALEDLKKEYMRSKKTPSLKNQKRISLIKHFIDNDIDVNDIMISVLPVPQIDMLLKNTPDNIRNSIKSLYSIIAMNNERIKYLCDLNSPTIIVDNQKRMLQEFVEKLFKKSLKVYCCEDISTNRDLGKDNYDGVIKSIFGISKDYDISVWENFVALLLCLDISSNENEKSIFNSFLLDNNAFEDQSVWNDYLYNL